MKQLFSKTTASSEAAKIYSSSVVEKLNFGLMPRLCSRQARTITAFRNLKRIFYPLLSLAAFFLTAAPDRQPVTRFTESYYTIFNSLLSTAQTAVFGEAQITPMFVIVGRVIGIVVSFAGSVFLLLTIIGGIQWMTAGGNEEQVGDARKRVTNALIGLGIVIGGYVVARTAVRLVLYVIS